MIIQQTELIIQGQISHNFNIEYDKGQNSQLKRFLENKFIKNQFYIESSQKSQNMKTIDHYTYNTFDSIGKGYSSQVYKGKDQKTNQQVAIKLIDLKFIKGQVHRKLLQNQISVLKQLKNQSNIIQMYDVFSTKTNTCIITQLCDQDLSRTIKNKKNLTQSEALPILKQIINGYRSIYSNDIIHRDLKPANIFFSSHNIKIADFGFAVKSNQIKKRESYNVGSPVYMPYEALTDNVYSYKSDIWAIGIIYYEMLTGRTPWRAKTESDLKKMLKTTSIRTILPSRISKISEEFLVKTLAFEPDNRMSAEQLCNFFSKSSHELEMSIQPKKLLGTTLNQYNSAFRTRAISQQTQSRNQTNRTDFTANNQISGLKTYKKINILKGTSQQTNYEAKFLKTRATIKEKSSNDGSFQEIDPKKISNQLVCQLHMCRFLFKLIQRIDKNQLIDQNQQLRSLMSQIIFTKLNKLKNLEFLDKEIARQFRTYSQYAKLSKICDQYTQKYSKALNFFYSNLFLQSQNVTVDYVLQSEVRNLYTYMIQFQNNPEEVRDQVVLLDYLITLKQLIMLDDKSNLEEFQRKSKIEDIVEGKPTANITKEHISAINTKVRAMKIIC